jgi:predicted nucleotide-binding protein
VSEPLTPSFRRPPREESWYDTMQVCENGHVVTYHAKSQPASRKNFCTKCGAPTLTACRNCNTEIPGDCHNSSVILIPPSVPACCGSCGEPFPWTTNKQQEESKFVPVPVGSSDNQPEEAAEDAEMATTNKVFIVHGHAEDMKQAAARVLLTLGLDPIILHEQPNEGRTIIEKFETHADVGFAVVLLSGDDMAYPATVERKKAKPRPRARQNVVLELGYFLGKLGRHKVFPLYKGDDGFELPSDIQGVIYTEYDSAESWRFKLAQELKAAGYDADANKLIRA